MATQARSSKFRSFLYAVMHEERSGTWPLSLWPSKFAADRAANSRPVRRIEFVPFGVDKRFRVVVAQGYAVALEGMTSLIEVPPWFSQASDEHPFFDGMLFDRQQGFDVVADLNRDLAAEWDDDAQQWRSWYVLAETGQSVGMPLSHVSIDSNGMGVEHRTMNRPLRLVWPTVEELAHWPLEAGGRSGRQRRTQPALVGAAS